MEDQTVIVLSPAHKTPVSVTFCHEFVFTPENEMRVITTCVIIPTAGGIVLSGTAVCSPHDRHKSEIGQRLAFRRAIEDGMHREPAIRGKENQRTVLTAWRKALWEARNPDGWKKPEPVEVTPVELPAEVESSIPY